MLLPPASATTVGGGGGNHGSFTGSGRKIASVRSSCLDALLGIGAESVLSEWLLPVFTVVLVVIFVDAAILPPPADATTVATAATVGIVAAPRVAVVI